MVIGYYKLWKRADKHLDTDITDLFIHEGKDGEEEEAAACSLSGMTNAYAALKYLIMDALRVGKVQFNESDKLSTLLDTMLVSDSYAVTREDIQWAYEMENWEEAYELNEDGEPYCTPRTNDELESISDKIWKLKGMLAGEEQ